MTTIVLPDSSKLLLLLLFCLIQVKLLHGYRRTVPISGIEFATHEQVTVAGLISLFWYEKGSCQTDENKTHWNDKGLNSRYPTCLHHSFQFSKCMNNEPIDRKKKFTTSTYTSKNRMH